MESGDRRTIVVVVDEGEGSERPEQSGGDAVAAEEAPPVPEPAPTPPNPRQVRARRRRRRRQLGTLLFVLVAGAILATAYFALTGDDDDPADGPSIITEAIPTTVAPPYSAVYQATTGINVRQVPATSAPIVAVVEQGRDVTVTCAIQGEVVNAPSGPNANWLRTTDPGAAGYVSAAFVSVGQDLASGKIPACPAA